MPNPVAFQIRGALAAAFAMVAVFGAASPAGAVDTHGPITIWTCKVVEVPSQPNTPLLHIIYRNNSSAATREVDFSASYHGAPVSATDGRPVAIADTVHRLYPMPAGTTYQGAKVDRCGVTRVVLADGTTLSP